MTIHLIREPLTDGSARRTVGWCYSYSIDGAPAVVYGSHLGSLRDLVRRKYRGATVSQSW